jgi:hypothetical protein
MQRLNLLQRLTRHSQTAAPRKSWSVTPAACMPSSQANWKLLLTCHLKLAAAAWPAAQMACIQKTASKVAGLQWQARVLLPAVALCHNA